MSALRKKIKKKIPVVANKWKKKKKGMIETKNVKLLHPLKFFVQHWYEIRTQKRQLEYMRIKRMTQIRACASKRGCTAQVKPVARAPRSWRC